MNLEAGNPTPVGHDSMADLQRAVHKWADETFPDRPAEAAWLKLFEELGEAIKTPHAAEEWGDIMIMLFDLATIYGVDLYEATILKLNINRGRKWQRLGTGVYSHVKEP